MPYCGMCGASHTPVCRPEDEPCCIAAELANQTIADQSAEIERLREALAKIAHVAEEGHEDEYTRAYWLRIAKDARKAAVTALMPNNGREI